MGIRHSSDANDGDPAIRWSQRCDGGKRFDAIDAKPTDLPTCTPGQSYNDGRVSVWREINEMLGEERSAPPYSIPDRIRALVAEVKRLRAKLELVESWNDQIAAILGCDPGETVSTAQRTAGDLVAARAEIARLEARDREGWWLVATGNEPWDDSEGPEYQRRCAAYLSGEPPAPDPLLVEAREVLRSLETRNWVEGGGCWCRWGDPGSVHQGYCDRANALLTKLDARIGGR